MRKVAIVYASKMGQTEKIARYLEEKLQERGLLTERHRLDHGEGELSPNVEAVILGGPVYAGKFRPSLLAWAKDHTDIAARLPVALFTVTLNAADKHESARADDARLLRELAEQTGWQPRLGASFAGALKYREYSWPVRWLMRRIARKAGGDTDWSHDYEYTDWARVEDFARAFSAEVLSENRA